MVVPVGMWARSQQMWAWMRSVDFVNMAHYVQIQLTPAFGLIVIIGSWKLNQSALLAYAHLVVYAYHLPFFLSA